MLEIPEGTFVTVEVSDDSMPPTYTPFGELLRLRPARYPFAADDLGYPARFSVQLRDLDASMRFKLKARLALAMRIVADPLQMDFIAYFFDGDDCEMAFQMVNEPVFSMVA